MNETPVVNEVLDAGTQLPVAGAPAPSDEAGGQSNADDAEFARLVPAAFNVVDAGSANWVVRKIVEARAYRERVEAWADQEIRRSQREEAFFTMRYGRQLEAWANHEIEHAKNRRRSVALPAGLAGFRQQPGKIVIDDERAVLDWARVNCPEAVRTIEQLSKSTIVAHVEKTGEVPEEGLHFEPPSEKFYIR